MISEETFLGNEKAVRYLNRVLQKGSVSHAYLFEGPEHVGKTTLALRFASELLGDDYEHVLQNPDLLFVAVAEDEKEIVIESIRDLQKNLSLYPFKAKYKVAIVEKAELMNRTAANALLKTLEEPGQTSVLLLLSADAGSMLSTIKSRCQTLTFSTAPRSRLEKFLSDRGNGQAAEKIAEICDGKPGTAIALGEDTELLGATLEERSKALSLFAAGNFQRMSEAGRVGALERKEAIAILDIWTGALRRELVECLRKNGDRQRLAQLENAIEKTLSAKQAIAANNVNLKLALENLCLGL